MAKAIDGSTLNPQLQHGYTNAPFLFTIGFSLDNTPFHRDPIPAIFGVSVEDVCRQQEKAFVCLSAITSITRSH